MKRGDSSAFNLYDGISVITWRAGLDPDNAADRMMAGLAICLRSPLPVKRLGRNDIEEMGLRPFIVDGAAGKRILDLDAVKRYRLERSLNEIRLGVHIDENA